MTIRISIHAAREGGDVRRANRASVLTAISIHAAREGGDIIIDEAHEPVIISIHAAREGGDERFEKIQKVFIAFQSTPPVKAATAATDNVNIAVLFQSTPPVKAATST